MTLYKRPGTKFWWIRVEKDGVPHQKSSRTDSKREAREVEAAFRIELGSTLPAGAKPQTLAEFTSLLFPYWKRTVKASSKTFYVQSWCRLLDCPAMEKAALHEVNQRLVEQFITFRLGQGASIVRINHSIRTLRRALHLAAKWDLIKAAPTLELAGKDPQRDYVVSEAEFQKILSHAARPPFQVGNLKVPGDDGTVTRTLFTVLYDCGVRVGEAVALDWSDVNLTERWLYVREGKTKFARRRVPMTARVVAALSALPAREGLVFKGWTVGKASQRFLRMRRLAGVSDKCVAHSLRHSCATRLGNLGANVLDLQKFFGWSSPTIAARYVHLDDDRMAALRNLLEGNQGK